MMKQWLILNSFMAVLLLSSVSKAWVSYDVGLTSGNDNSDTYTEIHVGLNWYAVDWLNWRNAIFTRFGTDLPEVNGWDTSLLPTLDLETSGHGFGIQLFAGPGLRFATANNSGDFLEGGIVFNFSGLHLGVGARDISYYNTRYDNLGYVLPKNEPQVFIIIAGGF